MSEKKPRVVFLFMVILAGLFNRVAAQDAAPPEADLPLGELVYIAKFAKDPNWAAGVSADGTLTWEPIANGLSMTSLNASSPSHYVPGTAYLATDFYVEMVFTPIACADPESAIILNVRSDPSLDSPDFASAYAFVVECDGTYRSRVVTDGASGLIDFTGDLPAPLVMNKPVYLGVLVNGRSVTWYLNQARLGSYFTSSAPVEGQFALGAQLGLSVVVNDLRVWELAETAEPPDVPESLNTADPLREWQLGRNIFVETFEEPDNPLAAGWASPLTGIRIQGYMIVTAREPRLLRYLIEPPDANTYPAYYAEVIFQARDCPERGAFGLVAGGDEDDFLALVMHCDGSYLVQSYVDGMPGEPLLAGQFDPLEPYGSGHALGMVVDGDMLYAYYDSTLVGNMELPGINQQHIGLIWLGAEDTITEMGIDTLSVVELLEP